MRRSALRGTATIEGVMVMLVFVALWAGVLYVGRLYESQLVARAEARECAWLIAENACRKIPSNCRSQMSDGDTGGDKSDDLTRSADDASLGDSIASAFREVLMDHLEGLFKSRIEATSERDVKKPFVIGAGQVEVTGTFSLPCNTKEFRFEDIAKDMWDAFLRKQEESE